MSETTILLLMTLEILAAAGLIFTWIEYGARISAWEDRTWERIKENRRMRRRARQMDQCRKLAEDGVYAVPPWAGGNHG